MRILVAERIVSDGAIGNDEWHSSNIRNWTVPQLDRTVIDMMNTFAQINWLSVAVASFASFALGGLWFTALFAKPYAVALGREGAPKTKPAPIYMVGPLLCGIVTTVTSAFLIYALKVDSMAGALAFGTLVGFGYMAATTVNTAINPNIPRPLFYGVVSGSYFLLAGLSTSVILVAMK